MKNNKKRSLRNKAVALSLVMLQLSGITAFAAQGASDAQVGGTVGSKMTQSYTVVVPEKISFGNLESQSDLTYNYDVEVMLTDGSQGDITVKSEKEITMKNSDNAITLKNNWGETSVYTSRTISSSMEFSLEDVKTATPGNYAGSVNFDVTYRPYEIIDETKAEIPTITESNANSTVEKERVEKLEGTTISQGINSVVAGNTSSETTYFVIDSICHENPANSSAFSEILSGTGASTESNVADMERLKSKVDNNEELSHILDYFTVDIVKACDETNNKELLTELDSVLEIRIPYDMTKLTEGTELGIARVHNNETQQFTTLNSRPSLDGRKDGTFFKGEDCVYIYSSKFSVFALLETSVTTTPEIGEADYSAVEAAKAKYDALDSSLYTSESMSAVINAYDAIDWTLKEDQQDKVDQMAADLEAAIKALVPKDTDSNGDSNGNNDGDNSTDNDTTVLKDGTYTATTSIRSNADFNKNSICDDLFYKEADVVVKGDTAELTMYVINPVPNFASFGVPISKTEFLYSNNRYDAIIDDSENDEKYFDYSGMFIPENGMYTTAAVTVEVPTDALIQSGQGALKVYTYVNAVMNNYETFYVVLTDFVNEDGDNVEGIPPVTTGPTVDNDGNSGDSDSDDNILDLPSANISPDEFGNGSYTGSVSLRKVTDINSKSMCDSLFYSKVDIVVSGDHATLTLYVIDPIPSYADQGTPLSNIKFSYSSKTYTGRTVQDSSVIRRFGAAPGFIEQAGDYVATKIITTVPKQAVIDAATGKLKCEAHINAVMQVTQEFYVVITDIQSGKTVSSATTPTTIEEITNVEQESSTLEVVEKIDEIEETTLDHEITSEGMLQILANSDVIRTIFYVTLVGLIIGSGILLYWKYRRKKCVI